MVFPLLNNRKVKTKWRVDKATDGRAVAWRYRAREKGNEMKSKLYFKSLNVGLKQPQPNATDTGPRREGAQGDQGDRVPSGRATCQEKDKTGRKIP